MTSVEETKLVSNVYAIAYAFLKRLPPILSLEVTGDVSTGGWSEPQLRRKSEHPVGGILEFDFVALPPPEASTDVISSIKAETEVENDVKNIRGVRVYAQNNTLTTIFGESGLLNLGPIRTIEEEGLGPDPK